MKLAAKGGSPSGLGGGEVKNGGDGCMPPAGGGVGRSALGACIVGTTPGDIIRGGGVIRTGGVPGGGMKNDGGMPGGGQGGAPGGGACSAGRLREVPLATAVAARCLCCFVLKARPQP